MSTNCDIWHQGLSPDNIKAGFKATGIYPVDSTKFPKDRLDKRLVKQYDLWVSLGKPNDLMDEMAHSIATPQKVRSLPSRSEEKSSDKNKQSEYGNTAPASTSKDGSTSIHGPSTSAAGTNEMYLRRLMATNVIVQLVNS